jgi:hypothetical protein
MRSFAPRDCRSARDAWRCVALLLAAVGCVACDDDPLELTNDDREVVVPDRYRSCSVDEDCTLVSVSCDGCCQRDAVTKELEEKFDRDRRESCAGFSGDECDCSFQEMRALCEKERCVAIQIPVD